MANPQRSPIHTLMWNTDRSSTRKKVGRESTLRGDDGAPRDIILEDLSLTGFRASGPNMLKPGDEILVGLAGVGIREAKVIWSQDRISGCEFLEPITDAEMELAITASTVVQGAFVWAQKPGGDTDTDDAPRNRLSYRRRLAIVGAAAIAAWAMWISIARFIVGLFF